MLVPTDSRCRQGQALKWLVTELRPEPFSKVPIRELAARVSLFGSPEVRALWEAATEAMADLHNVCTEGGFYTRQGTLPSDITDPQYLRFKAAQEKTEQDLIERRRLEVEVDEHLKN